MSDDLSGDMLAPSWPNLVFNKFLFIPIFQENSYFFLFLVMIMYFKSLNVVDHMEND